MTRRYNIGYNGRFIHWIFMFVSVVANERGPF